MSTEQPKRWTTSASNVHRRVRCPGSHWAEQGLPETESEWSEQGTRLHELFAMSDAKFRALTPEMAGVTEQEFRLVNYARELADEAIARTERSFNIAPTEPYEEGSERELWLRAGLKKLLPGHCDRWRYYPELRLLVMPDAKFGFIEVDAAPLNIQMRTYAVQAAEEMEWDVECVVVAIVQPRANEEDGGEKLSLARYDKEGIALARKQLLEWRAAWLDPAAPRFASAEACRYCKAKLTCDAYRDRLAPATSVLPAELLPSLAACGEEEFVKLFVGVQMAQNPEVWKALVEEASIRISEGRMPGYRLKENAPRTAITDQRKAADIACELVGYDGYSGCAKLALGPLVKTLNHKRKAAGQQSTEAECKEIIAQKFREVTTKNEVRPSVVPAEPNDDAQIALSG